MASIYSSGIIITDNDGNIIDYNSVMKSILSEKEILNTNISSHLKELKNYQVFISKCEKYNIIIIRIEKEMNAFLEYVLDNSYDEIFVTDGKGIVLYCNQAFEKHYGLSKQEVLGKDVQFLEEQGIVDRILVHRVIESKQTITFEQHTATGKTIMNTIKPILDDKDEVIYVVENCRDISKQTQLKKALEQKNQEIKDYETKLKYFNTLDDKDFIEFQSKSMKKLNATIRKLSFRDVNLLLLGESGTGKTYLANKIHDLSLRANKPFVTINCTTIPEKLIESELFGYEKGSFTGASARGKEGLVQQAHTGTLFLDEIGELPITTQSKLLQLVQEKTYIPIGSVYPKTIDVRIIAATNKDLKKLIKEGKFREDLYYRLALGVIYIPSLRERPEDIIQLIDYYLELFNKKYDMEVQLSKEVLDIFKKHSWPGNIRELEHLLEFLVVDASSPNEIIHKHSLPNNIIKETKKIVNQNNYIFYESIPEYNEATSLNEKINSFEGKIIRYAYDKLQSSYKVADYLQISQSTAHRLINKHCKKERA